MAKQKARNKTKRATTTQRTSTARRKPWTNGQRLALWLAVISFFGLAVPAAFANWDKLVSKEQPNVDEVAVLTTLLEDRNTNSLELLAIAEKNVDDALKAVRESKEVSLQDKLSAEKTADELKTTLRTHKSEIQLIYNRWREAVKEKNAVESDLSQKALLEKLLELQREFDRQLAPSPLKQRMEDTGFRSMYADA